MADEKKPFHNPFAGLSGLRDSLPPGSPKKEKQPKPKPVPPKGVVRMERAGRNGKEVTVIEQLDLPVDEREAWLKSLKGTLGCGGTIEGTALVVQGDHRERVAQWLKQKGVKQVSVG
jgi:translation initiation factor 1